MRKDAYTGGVSRHHRSGLDSVEGAVRTRRTALSRSAGQLSSAAAQARPGPREASTDAARARLGLAHHPGIADVLPDALPAVLAMDEVALLARRQHPQAEAFQFAVADVVGFLSFGV